MTATSSIPPLKPPPNPPITAAEVPVEASETAAPSAPRPVTAEAERVSPVPGTLVAISTISASGTVVDQVPPAPFSPSVDPSPPPPDLQRVSPPGSPPPHNVAEAEESEGVVGIHCTTTEDAATGRAEELTNPDSATSRQSRPDGAATAAAAHDADAEDGVAPPTTPPSSTAAPAIDIEKAASEQKKSKKVSKSQEQENTKRKHISQASALEHETKSILGRISARDSSMVSRRAFSYEPSLEVFRDTSFTDYIRGALLGIPGIIEESDDEEEESEEEEESKNKDAKDNSEMKEGGKEAQKDDDAEKKKAEVDRERNGEDKGVAEGGEAAAVSPEEENESAKEPPRRHGTRAAKRAELEAKAQRETEDAQQQQQQQQPPAPTRASARIRARMIGSRCSQISKPGHSPSRRAISMANNAVNTFRGEPNEMLLADGIAKITPPKGWWDHAGIGGDLTGRGKIWSKGGRLGDIQVTTPIKQCASGIGGVYDFTMLELPPVTVHEFREQADAYRKRQIGREFDEDVSDEFVDGLARKFWKRLGPTMEPSIYGADMEGTLFDGDSACGWNVDRLESSLALLGADMDPDDDDDDDDHNGMPAGRLPGVTTAYLYFGMWGSVFAAHTEDMNLLSINYLHAGSPKYWYAIDPRDASRFESLATSHFAAAASQCPDFLRHKRYLLSPSILNKAGISYSTQVQRAGDVVITFPGSYHFGFNTGFNVAESTNFAVPEWLEWGNNARVCLCHPHSVRIDMARFRTLLDRYEAESPLGSNGGRMSYSEWARAEAARRVLEEEAEEYLNGDGDVSEEEGGKVKYGKASVRVVEVVRMKTKSASTSSSKRSKGKGKKKAEEGEDWRQALRVRPSVFHVGTAVLCFMRAEVDEEGEVVDANPSSSGSSSSERCFSGTVTDACEGHVRVHFAGTARKDDAWVRADSPKLFLDGGPAEPPLGEEEAVGRNKKATMGIARKMPPKRRRVG